MFCVPEKILKVKKNFVAKEIGLLSGSADW
jgi:hypothetical protein